MTCCGYFVFGTVLQTLALLNTSDISRKNSKLYVLRIARARLTDGPELFHMLSPTLHTFILDHDALVQGTTLDLLTELVPSIAAPQV